MTTDVITKLDIERALATRNFEDFLDYVRILEPPPGRGVIPFEKWPHLVETIDILDDERLLVILKARQVGISWLLAAYALWTAIYHRGAVVLELSQTEKVATALLGKCKTILSLLPPHLQTQVGQDSLTEMSFPDMQSKITALPSTESAGRSETATLVIQDEADYHAYLEANYAAVKPTIDAGGQLIMASTSNKRVATSLFKELYRGAPENGWKGQFIGWSARPGRDDGWLQGIRDNVPATLDMNPDLYMEQEYPATADEALAPSRVLSAFDPDILKLMQDDVRKPISKLGSANIYQRYAVGKKYAAGTDTSHGTGGDDAVTVIVDIMTGYVVADIQSSVMSPEDLAFQSVKLLEAYQNPIWAIEDNDWGIVTIRKAEELEYKQLYERANNKVGWHTDERTRTVLWGDLIEAINSRLLAIPSTNGLSQFVSVIRNPDKGGRIEAMSGTHDDYPMAVGIAWQMRNEAWNNSNKTLIHKFD
jgi:hypothetical protein